MEKKDWEQRLEDFYFEREKILPSQSVGIDIDDWKEFISQELDKARKEGYELGYAKGIVSIAEYKQNRSEWERLRIWKQGIETDKRLGLISKEELSVWESFFEELESDLSKLKDNK